MACKQIIIENNHILQLMFVQGFLAASCVASWTSSWLCWVVSCSLPMELLRCGKWWPLKGSPSTGCCFQVLLCWAWKWPSPSNAPAMQSGNGNVSIKYNVTITSRNSVGVRIRRCEALVNKTSHNSVYRVIHFNSLVTLKKAAVNKVDQYQLW